MNSGILAEQAAAKSAFDSVLKAHFGPRTTAYNRPPYWELPQDVKDAYWRCFRADMAVDAYFGTSSLPTVYAAPQTVGRYAGATYH
ncbi:MAG TPA: hypothetical protein VIE66_03450 [Methylocella sp.]|jgi:hypothetical protein